MEPGIWAALLEILPDQKQKLKIPTSEIAMNEDGEEIEKHTPAGSLAAWIVKLRRL